MFEAQDAESREQQSQAEKKRLLRFMPLIVIATFFLLFFGPTLFAGKFLIAGDAYYQSYPLRTIAWSAIRRGELPLWTNELFSGYPLLSMAQVAIGYPLTWFYLVLPGHWAEQIVVLAPFLLAPTFTYLYAKEVGLSHFAALVAGLSFTYAGNMSSKLGGLGLMANPELWLPLFLLALERSRRQSFQVPLVLGTGAYSMSILAGQAQAFLMVGMVGLVYGLFLSLFLTRDSQESGKQHLRISRWQSLCAAIASIALASGVSAFQILETLPVAQRSVRSHLTYEIFTEGSFTATGFLRSFLAPVHHYIEVSSYVAPIAALLAVYGCLKISNSASQRRIVFWLMVTAVAFLLMLGSSTPLYHLLYHVPIFNLFRYPSRHSFEWTFAVSMLAAYGIDALTRTLKTHRKEPSLKPVVIGWCLFVIGLIVGFLWWRAALHRPLHSNFGLDSGLIPGLPEHSYLVWKAAFTAVMVPLVWCAFKVSRTTQHINALLVCAIALALYVEPQIYFGHVWFPFAKTPTDFNKTSGIEQWLQNEQAKEQQRVYVRANLFARGYWTPPPIDLANMTAVRKLNNVGGYEQLVLDRYSKALGDVGPDGVNKRYGLSGLSDASLFSQQSHVLDLLSTRHVVAFPHLATSPEQLMFRDGIGFAEHELALTVLPGETVRLTAENASGNSLVLVTALSNSVEVTQNTPVAQVRVVDANGEVAETELLAGRDTAEWAHERGDVRGIVKHELARIFDSQPGDAQNSFFAYRYVTMLELPTIRSVTEVQIKNVAKQASLAVSKATLFDSVQKTSATLAAFSTLPASHWMPVANQEGVVVWRNERALPRAWLVVEVETVDTEQALARIRSSSIFDPGRTALVERTSDQSPVLNNTKDPFSGSARVTSNSSNSLTILTEASAPSVLVVSEIFYPGWEARIDNRPTTIFQTDYLLRGVAVPAGRHTIEMYYTAPGASKGLIISGISILFVCGLLAFSRRAHRARAA